MLEVFALICVILIYDIFLLLSRFYENLNCPTACVKIKVFVVFIVEMCLVFDRMP